MYTDKDQLECLRMLVIRYKMFGRGLVCQKSIPGVHFILPTGTFLGQPAHPVKQVTSNKSWFHLVIRSLNLLVWSSGWLLLFVVLFFPIIYIFILSPLFCAARGAGAFRTRLLSLQMTLAAGFSSQRDCREKGRESFVHTSFIGHGADLHSGVSQCSKHSSKQAMGETENGEQKHVKGIENFYASLPYSSVILQHC